MPARRCSTLPRPSSRQAAVSYATTPRCYVSTGMAALPATATPPRAQTAAGRRISVLGSRVRGSRRLRRAQAVADRDPSGAACWRTWTGVRLQVDTPPETWQVDMTDAYDDRLFG